MKLKNKLLPLVGISAACAAVAPIALTSCTTSDLVDLTQKYESQLTDIHGVATMDTTAALAAYYSRLATKPETFVDDFYWSQSIFNVNYAPRIYHSAESKEAEQKQLAAKAVEAKDLETLLAKADGVPLVGATSLSSVDILSTTSVVVSKDDEKITDFKLTQIPVGSVVNYAVSFKRTFDIEYSTSSNIKFRASAAGDVLRDVGTATQCSQKGTIEFKDVPLYIEYNYGTKSIMGYLWWLGVDYERLDYFIDSIRNDSYIKIQYDVDYQYADSEGSSTTSTNNYDVTVDSKCNFSKTLELYSELAYIIPLCASHYMWNVAYNGPKM